MKKILLPIFALVAILFAACGGDDKGGSGEPATIAVTGITLDKTMLALEIDESATVVATVEPANATNKDVEWSIADATIASVNNGVVKGLKEGETTLTAKTVDGNFTATIPVKVVTEKVPVEELALIYPTKVKVGKSGTLTVFFLPTNATNLNSTFIIDKPECVELSYQQTNGNQVIYSLKGVKEGTVKIKAVSEDGNIESNEGTTVVLPIIKVSSITISPETATIEKGDTKQLTAAVLPNDADNKEIEWSSSDTSVATVDANGLVTGVAEGEATITATAKDGSGVKGEATIKVVGIEPTALTFDGQTEAKFVTWHGNEVDLKAAADGDLKTLKWVFTPDQDTEYTEVISSDKATITAWSNENTMQSVVNVSVGKQTGGGVLARASVAFRTTAGMYTASDYKYFAAWWIPDNNFSFTVTTAREKYYFVAYCAPLSHSATHDPEMYYPDSYIPTSAYTLTTNNDKVTVKKLNDKCYEITDSDLSTYKELVLTYTCGKQIFTYTTKIVPR